MHKVRRNPPAYGGYKMPEAGPNGHWFYRRETVEAIRDGKRLARALR